MNRLISLGIVALVSFVANAELKKFDKAEFDKLDAEGRREYIGMIAAQKTGGKIVKPGTGKGVFKIVSSQKAAKLDEAKIAMKRFCEVTNIDVQFVDGAPVTFENAVAGIKTNGANAAVFVIEDAKLPRLLMSPEEGWAIVNVAKLKVDSPAQIRLDSRASKEVMRAFAFVGGMGQAEKYTPVLRPISEVADLDRIEKLFLAGGCYAQIPLALKSFGIEPKYVRTYRKAMEEGWAPKPVNEPQQLIWDEFNKAPSNPIKIEYDPKTGK